MSDAVPAALNYSYASKRVSARDFAEGGQSAATRRESDPDSAGGRCDARREKRRWKSGGGHVPAGLLSRTRVGNRGAARRDATAHEHRCAVKRGVSE